MQRVVPGRRVVHRASLKNGKLFFNVLIERQDDGQGWHEDRADKRLDEVCERSSDSVRRY